MEKIMPVFGTRPEAIEMFRDNLLGGGDEWLTS